MLAGSALDGEWTKQLPKHDMTIVGKNINNRLAVFEW